MFDHLYRSANAVHQMSFESAITIILTALAVILAVVTLGIAGLAIWGYVGLRDSLKETATKRADEAIQGALKKYPDAADMLKTLQRLRDQADFLDEARNRVVTIPDPKLVEMASNSDIQEATPIAEYPGEGRDDADDNGKSG